MPTTVRFASDGDIEELIALNAVVQSLHAVLYPDSFKPAANGEAARAMFAARLASPECRTALAEIDGAPVGYILFEIQARAETAFNPARRRLYVHHLCVVEAMRRRGVATELLRLVERFSTAEGIGEIALDAWAANAGAIRFFELIGFQTFNIALRKSIPPS